MDMSIGQRVVRKDACSKVEGLELYVDDLSWPNLHYAAIVRSSVSHAEISKVFIKPGVNLPSETQLITSTDIPGKNIVHMCADSCFAYSEFVSNCFIAFSFCNELQNFYFSGCEGVRLCVLVLSRGSNNRKRFKSDGWRKCRFTAANLTDIL